MFLKKIIKVQTNFDESFSKFYKSIILFFSSFVFINYIFWIFYYSKQWDGWIIGDWLINYSSGFSRRGLLGEFIIFASNTFKIKLNITTSILQITLLLTFIFYIIKILTNKIITFWYIYIFTLPTFISFYFFNIYAIGRKEILLFVLFSAWIFYIKKYSSINFKISIIFSILGALITFAHEIFFFYSFYFYFSAYLVKKSFFEKIKFSLLIPIFSFFSVIILFFFGENINSSSCLNLLELGANENVCSGIFSWPLKNSYESFLYVYNSFNSKSLIHIPSIFFILILPFFLFFAANRDYLISMKLWIFSILGLIIITIPLFLLANDWGRWINVHTTLLFLSSALLLKNYNKKIKKKFLKKKFNNKKIFLGLIILSSSLFWSVKYCCASQGVSLGGFVSFVIKKILNLIII